ncbi:ABC transporter substrate-binding protein [Amycolatopsis pigmentata]|uniref:ABC transporter substrate-binding protein n=1 Tax=Amycolatopsis pigmentata TaxID=450801 RepID=A0ABW5FND1_9PSEU
MKIRPSALRAYARPASVAAAALLMVALAACGSTSGSGATSGGTLKIGFVTTLSKSSFSDVGEQAKAAFEAGIANSKSSGLTIQTYEQDDQGNPQQATQVCQQLVQQSHVDVIVAVMLTPNKNACNVIAQQANVAFVAGQQSAVNCGPTYFQTGWVPNQVIEPTLKYLATKNAKTIYYVGNNYAFDQEILKNLQSAATAAGMQVVGNSMPPVGTTAWAPIFDQVVAAHPDVVIDGMVDTIAYQKQASTDPRMEALRRLSFTTDEGQLHVIGASVKGLEYVTQYLSTQTGPANESFKAALAAANKSVFPSLASVNLYNATLAAVAAAKQGSGSADILKNLPRVSITGPGGNVAFGGGHNPVMTSYVAVVGDELAPSVEYTQNDVAPRTGC